MDNNVRKGLNGDAIVEAQINGIHYVIQFIISYMNIKR